MAERPLSAHLQVVTGVASAVAVGSVVVAAQRIDYGGWWLPGLTVWAATLTTAAMCDIAVQRIPTLLVRCGGSVAAVLLVVAGVVTQDWAGLIVTLAAAGAAGVILAMCWRFAGVGFGDVRLAALGGLGLGHATYQGVAAALLGFAVVTMAQAAWVYLRTRDRSAHFPFGPALALSFLVAAVW
jgi:leader peptidase (prepilin peptidase)/N-methyltransferase